MVKTIHDTIVSDQESTSSPQATEDEEFLYEAQLNERIANRRRRNALNSEDILNLQNFIKEVDPNVFKFD